MRCELLVAGIGNIISLGPIGHRVKINVDEGRHKIALIAKRNDFLDLREKLKLVFEELGRKHTTVIQFADILGTIDNSEMTATRFQSIAMALRTDKDLAMRFQEKAAEMEDS